MMAFCSIAVCLIVVNSMDSAFIHCVSTTSPKQITLKLILSDSCREEERYLGQSLFTTPSKTYGSHRKLLQPSFSSDEMRETVTKFDL